MRNEVAPEGLLETANMNDAESFGGSGQKYFEIGRGGLTADRLLELERQADPEAYNEEYLKRRIVTKGDEN